MYYFEKHTEMTKSCLVFHIHWAGRILVLRPGIEPLPPAMEAQRSNQRTTREVPGVFAKFISNTEPSLAILKQHTLWK